MATKRLIKELDAYNREPSAALTHLAPVSDDDVFQLAAVLRGPEGTAYEGKDISLPQLPFQPTEILTFRNRRPMEPPNHSPLIIPQHPTRNPLPNAHLPSERELQNWRDLFGFVENELDARVWDCEHVGGY